MEGLGSYGVIVFLSWLIVVPYFWMTAIAIKNDQYIWGILIFMFFFPSFLYGIIYWDKAKIPFIIGVVILLLLASIFWSSFDEIVELSKQEELRINAAQNEVVDPNAPLPVWKD